ncbi:MAG: permease-like cell division protein FtsX [Aliidiomarina sp.]|uniref:permease-like cell division protein FtsX n=1 Tax=Aliidiomarina sp. TaxID=1872439 RepID=UPI0025B9AE8D|nr:permease-like cell division protein FtsX [Aliidiomarina sp.]MCH8501630.1 permease-like cell division protein FtsX [Aliidiomarina sp.]
MGLISSGSSKKSSGARSVKISFWRRLVMFFVTNLQQGIGSLGELSRTPWASLMTIAVLGLSLTLPATLYVVVKNAQSATGEWDQAAEISLFLRKDLQTQEIQSFRERVRLMNEVETVNLIDREAGLREFRESSGFGSALDYLQSNPLPDVLVVVPVPEYRSSERAQRLLGVLEQEREVDSARLDLQWLQRLQAIVNVVENSLAALAILLSLAVVLIVGNTIRLAILNRRDEIMIMKLVGATNAYIQRPFLYTGFWYGVIGGVIAWISTTLMVWWISASVAQLTALYDSSFRLAGLDFSEMMVLWLVAIVLGLLGSWIAVRRHVAAIEPT